MHGAQPHDTHLATVSVAHQRQADLFNRRDLHTHQQGEALPLILIHSHIYWAPCTLLSAPIICPQGDAQTAQGLRPNISIAAHRGDEFRDAELAVAVGIKGLDEL